MTAARWLGMKPNQQGVYHGDCSPHSDQHYDDNHTHGSERYFDPHDCHGR
jgi:hypothetical protein